MRFDGWNTIEGRHLVFAYAAIFFIQGGYFLSYPVPPRPNRRRSGEAGISVFVFHTRNRDKKATHPHLCFGTGGPSSAPPAPRP